MPRTLRTSSTKDAKLVTSLSAPPTAVKSYLTFPGQDDTSFAIESTREAPSTFETMVLSWHNLSSNEFNKPSLLNRSAWLPKSCNNPDASQARAITASAELASRRLRAYDSQASTNCETLTLFERAAVSLAKNAWAFAKTGSMPNKASAFLNNVKQESTSSPFNNVFESPPSANLFAAAWASTRKTSNAPSYNCGGICPTKEAQESTKPRSAGKSSGRVAWRSCSSMRRNTGRCWLHGMRYCK
mmetsp:Transcript_10888/g.22159  ORF Transcript_10888/g.22159 Transcript_10888/m.22159 type:complete len:243 (+) Transcript_10888:881-1609(+)